MSGNAARLQAMNNVEAYVPPAFSFDPGEAPGEVFGSNVFTKSDMQARMPKAAYKSVVATIDKGAKLDPAVADAVAAAMKDWALEKGATHYAHVFYPMTGLTAEKHDSFLEPVSDGQTLAEYALILALIAVVAVVALIFLGGTITNLFSSVGNTV